MGDEDKFELQKRSEGPVNYHSANMLSDWRLGSANFANSPMGSIPTGKNSMAVCEEDMLVGSLAGSTGPMIDSYCLPQWDNSTNSENLGFSDINEGNGTNTSNVMGFGRVGSGVLRNGIDRRPDNSWNLQSSMLKGGLFLSNVPSMIPHSLSQFPADSGFIERAARYSCFSNGNFSDMVNPFGATMQRLPDVLTENVIGSLSGGHSQKNEKDTSLSIECGVIKGSPIENEESSLAMSHDEVKQAFHVSENESDEADLSAGGQAEASMFANGLGSKKRKRISQGTELDQVKGDPLPSCDAAIDNTELQQKNDQNPSLTICKNTGKKIKNGSQATTDPAKEEYIHVRARRGQATNSHSLAERVRREKISERMKFLQDLVPGCSKVTVKAVMLDEIINYVQSLQRQVEFLSMKLATVNPRLDINSESLLTKDIIQSRPGPSASLGYTPDVNMSFPQLLPSQPGLIQTGLRNSETLLRTLNTEFANMNRGYNEPTTTTPLQNVWEDELHKAVQMGLGPNTPIGGQDLNGSMSQDHLKVEL